MNLDDEQLSRYLSGDLEPAEMAAIRAVEGRGGVAKRLGHLRAVIGALEALDGAMPPPRRSTPRAWPVAACVGAAAGVAMALGRGAAIPEVAFGPGVYDVRGHVVGLVGSERWELDGKASWRSVEPSAGVARELAGEATMNGTLKTLGAGVVGCCVGVLGGELFVREGEAQVTDAEGPPSLGRPTFLWRFAPRLSNGPSRRPFPTEARSSSKRSIAPSFPA